MTDAILLDPDRGEVRLVTCELDRRDVLLDVLDADDLVDLDLDDLRLVFPARTDGRFVNVPATLLAYGTGRPMTHAIRGPVLVFALDRDHGVTDVPDDLVLLFDD